METTGLTPRQELHPDLCVAFGAGVLAARLAGHDVERVLVDISPYSFGPSYFGVLDGMPSEHCYRPIIHRNTPLPVSRTDSYCTMVDNQEAWRVSIYQGEDPNALNNILIGRFFAEGFSQAPAGNEILCRMDLNLDGILHVTVTEKRTGRTKHISIEGATTAMSREEVARARQRMHALFDEEEDDEFAATEEEEVALVSAGSTAEEHRDHRVRVSEARALLERSQRLFEKMNPEDREEAISLHERIEEALREADGEQLQQAITSLADLLFYVEEG